MSATLPPALLTYRNVPAAHTDPLSLPLGLNPWSPNIPAGAEINHPTRNGDAR